jgi:hypothetical protein
MSDDLDVKRPKIPPSDAEVTDRLLRIIRPTVDPAAEAARIDRIVAASARMPRLAAIEAAVPPRAASAHRLTAVLPSPAQPAAVSPRPSRFATHAGAAGLMAASLLVGVLLGQTSGAGEAVRGFEAATGWSVAAVSLEAVAAEISEE